MFLKVLRFLHLSKTFPFTVQIYFSYKSIRQS